MEKIELGTFGCRSSPRSVAPIRTYGATRLTRLPLAYLYTRLTVLYVLCTFPTGLECGPTSYLCIRKRIAAAQDFLQARYRGYLSGFCHRSSRLLTLDLPKMIGKIQPEKFLEQSQIHRAQRDLTSLTE